MKRITARQWAEVLIAMTREIKEAEVSHKIKNFVSIVRARRSLKLFPAIIRIYRTLIETELQIVHIKTTAARELPHIITKQLSELGKEVIIDHTIDPTVIGGIRIMMDDVIIDGTVATRLKKLYES